MKVRDWRGKEIELVESRGGVLAFANPWEGVVHGGVDPWPPPELVQKLYQSNHAGAIVDAANIAATSFLGYYSDLQSMHSEDAVTWSLFGPITYADSNVRAQFCAQLLGSLGIERSVSNARIWLWRRLPHPDTRVSGGPEINFGIQTADALILGESKWCSAFGARQGVDFSGFCPIRQQLMSNLPCALRFTSILVPRYTVRGGMRAAMTPVAAPATDELPGRIERARRLGDPESSSPRDGQMQRCGRSP
jgi:hypothetical protein